MSMIKWKVQWYSRYRPCKISNFWKFQKFQKYQKKHFAVNSRFHQCHQHFHTDIGVYSQLKSLNFTQKKFLGESNNTPWRTSLPKSSRAGLEPQIHKKQHFKLVCWLSLLPIDGFFWNLVCELDLQSEFQKIKNQLVPISRSKDRKTNLICLVFWI